MKKEEWSGSFRKISCRGDTEARKKSEALLAPNELAMMTFLSLIFRQQACPWTPPSFLDLIASQGGSLDWEDS